MGTSSSITLNNGIEMPVLGLGTWKMNDAEAEASVLYALEIGYRHIDTATYYGNERGVGRAVRESGLPREEIFVTTKLWPADFSNPRKAFQKSRERLGLEYVDLYLVHWPVSLMPQSVWQALEKLYEEKLARAIGVSNYGIEDIDKLLSYASVPPAVNQIKFSPYDYDEEILNYCYSKDIAVEAYSPLTQGNHLHDQTIKALARTYAKTPAQIMIRWALQHDTIVIPKSSRREHIRENAAVFDFEINTQDMKTLSRLT